METISADKTKYLQKIDKFYVMYYEALFLGKLNLFINNMKVDFK